MPHQNLDSYLLPQSYGDDADRYMLAAEKAIAHFTLLQSKTEAQSYKQRVIAEPHWSYEELSEQSCYEGEEEYEEEEEKEEENLLKLPYFILKIMLEEANDHLKQAKQTSKYLENVYHTEKKLELTANVKGKSEKAYQRFVWHGEKQFYPALQIQRYREIRKAYYQAFIARKISRLKNFLYAIKETFEWFIIKPIKEMWERIKRFNTPIPKVYYKENEVVVGIEKEKENRRGDEVFRVLYSPLEKMQSELENQKETREQAKQVPEIVDDSSIRHRHR